ncbi:FUSC family protein [Marinobacterium sp. D7]|uniref:FUSC family protein n=1 Tax=Marinobacterium ramblicola TaxID=2849041 RepID=UPI001C2CEF44|nr:FUSC family protein [Marinobacterium ramblicola]MBV1789967.1 FUSC family protein [Marinobacterium ramblicola]
MTHDYPSPTRHNTLWLSIKQIGQLLPSTRPLHRGILSAIACSLPAFTGILSGRFTDGLLACMGALVILYLPDQRLRDRIFVMLSCSFIFAISFAAGSLAAISSTVSVIAIGLLASLGSIACTGLAIAPPGNFFFIMLASVATVMPYDPASIPERTGLIALGSLSSCALAVLYSLLTTANNDEGRVPAAIGTTLNHVPFALFDGVIIACAYALALLLELDNPYWAPISCAAVLQGGKSILVWTRKVQRIIGTVLGLGIAWGLFSLQLLDWQIATAILLLTLAIETLIYRNYALGVVFITPLTLLFADITSPPLSTNALIYSRFIDIALGSSIGAIGGWLGTIRAARYTPVLK